jgi:hypothetical protein
MIAGLGGGGYLEPNKTIVDVVAVGQWRRSWDAMPYFLYYPSVFLSSVKRAYFYITISSQIMHLHIEYTSEYE